MKIFKILLPFILLSCTSKDLRIEHLKFNDIERSTIKINKIKESRINYDTTVLNMLSLSNSSYDREKLIEFCKNGIGTGLIKYDSSGNIVYHNIKEFMGTTQSFEYDSLGLLKKKVYDTDFRAEFNIRYVFDNKNLELFQIWTQDISADTTLFKFNDKGYIISEKGRFHDDKSGDRKYLRKYLYRNDSLVNITTSYFNDFRHLTRTEESFTYRKDVISKIEKLFYYSTLDTLSPQIVKETKEFDNKGLPVRIKEKYQDSSYVIKIIENK